MYICIFIYGCHRCTHDIRPIIVLQLGKGEEDIMSDYHMDAQVLMNTVHSSIHTYIHTYILCIFILSYNPSYGNRILSG